MTTEILCVGTLLVPVSFKVLEQIRLPLISPSYLPTVIESLDVVKEHQGCQRFISEAKELTLNVKTASPRRNSGTQVCLQQPSVLFLVTVGKGHS